MHKNAENPHLIPKQWVNKLPKIRAMEYTCLIASASLCVCLRVYLLCVWGAMCIEINELSKFNQLCDWSFANIQYYLKATSRTIQYREIIMNGFRFNIWVAVHRKSALNQITVRINKVRRWGWLGILIQLLLTLYHCWWPFSYWCYRWCTWKMYVYTRSMFRIRMRARWST